MNSQHSKNISQLTKKELLDLVDDLEGWPHKETTKKVIAAAPNDATAQAHYKIALYRNMYGNRS